MFLYVLRDLDIEKNKERFFSAALIIIKCFERLKSEKFVKNAKKTLKNIIN